MREDQLNGLISFLLLCLLFLFFHIQANILLPFLLRLVVLGLLINVHKVQALLWCLKKQRKEYFHPIHLFFVRFYTPPKGLLWFLHLQQHRLMILFLDICQSFLQRFPQPLESLHENFL